jgi:uncharacterized phage-associated protein
MSYDPKAIANYFLDQAKSEGASLTPMKIQKLVYFSHGWHLAIKNLPLINEQVEAWEFGPVIPSLYRAFRGYGNQAVTAPAAAGMEWMQAFYPDEKLVLAPTIDDCPERAPFTKQLLEKIWKVYGGYTATQLSNITHAPDTPWKQIFDQHHGEIPKRTDIPTEMIKAYFVKLSRGEAHPQ